MRPLSELYKLVIQNIKDMPIYTGLCYRIKFLYIKERISAEEYQVLAYDFKNNKPTNGIHTEFFNHPTFTDGLYWWSTSAPEALQQRLLFLEKMVEINEERNE